MNQHFWLVKGGLALDNVLDSNRVSISRLNAMFSFFGDNVSGGNPSASGHVLMNTINADNTSTDLNIANGEPYTIPDESARQVVITYTTRFGIEDTMTLHFRTNGTTGLGGEYVHTYNPEPNGTTTNTFSFQIAPTAGDVGSTMGLYIEHTDAGGNGLIQFHDITINIFRVAEATQNQGLTQFRLGDTLPPTPISAFLLAYKNTFCTTLHIDSQKKVITMNYAKDALSKAPIAIEDERVVTDFKKTPKNLTAYKLTWGTEVKEPSRYLGEYPAFNQLPAAQLNNTALVTSEASYYSYEYLPDEGTQRWVKKEAYLDSFTLGTGTELTELKPEVNIPEMQRQQFPEVEGETHPTVLVPLVEYQGASQLAGMPADTDHELFFLLKAGMQPVQTTGSGTTPTYPMATTTGRNIYGAHTMGIWRSRSLLWGGQHGLAKTFWAEWIALMVHSEIIEVDINLPLALEQGQDLNQTLLLRNQKLLPVDVVINHQTKEAPTTLVTRKIQGENL
ncbi:MAG: hypothetical protein ACRBFS_20895 [Aureispira sp.]